MFNSSSRIALMAAALGGAMASTTGAFANAAVAVRDFGSSINLSGPRRTRGYGPSRKEMRDNPQDYRSPAKLRKSIGHIGMGMHSSGTRATRLNGKGVITATPVEKGPARTLSVRDLKLTMAQGRRYERMRPFERQRRLTVLFGMGA